MQNVQRMVKIYKATIPENCRVAPNNESSKEPQNPQTVATIITGN